MNSSDTFFNICTRCLGRAFAMEGHGITNIQRGEAFLASPENKLPGNVKLGSEKNCSICHGIFLDMERYAEMCMQESSRFEFSTFLVGSVFPQEDLDYERDLQSIFGEQGESIKKEFNREFGKFLSSRLQKEVSFKEPEITFLINTKYDSVNVQVKSLFIRGIYKKYRRDIPQTRWIHKTGNGESIESIIGSSLTDLSECTNYYLHGAGREDVDVRMLGNGREFVIEAERPCKRIIDLKLLQNKVNNSGKGVEISDLSFSDISEVRKIKGEKYSKTYQVKVGCNEPIDCRKLENSIKELIGKVIYQRTPLRVSGSRSDLVRERMVRDIRLDHCEVSSGELEVTAESGMYIKELINGDNGRTVPSLSSVYGSDLRVIELDVVRINRSDE